jgi:serine/threonine-protein kinase RsbW
VDADAPITARELIPEDAPGLARCIYRCYGYTYPNDFIYYHDQVISLIERGLLRSFVGVNPDGEVVGHSGIIRDRPEARVAESGMAAVDPRYRHHHLLESIIAHRVNACRGMGLVGTYADAVAVHPITQKASVAIGATEIGILLAEIPQFTTFRGITQEPDQRGSVVMYFHVLGEAPARQVFLPPRYHALLGSIYRRLGLRRTLDVAADTDTSSTFSPSSVHVDIKKRRGLARIEVESAGNDVVALVSQRLQELRLQRLDVVHLDLPLGDAAAMAAVDEFAELGFFYGALVPELRDGDVLRLQCLNNVDVDPDSLVLHTDEAKRILRAILADR